MAIDGAALPLARRTLSLLAVAAGLVGNLIPLYGILAWGWDTFQLLMLYWMETVIIAFWTLMRLGKLSAEERGTMTVNGKTRPASRSGLVGFFAFHAGMFILVHLLFLWILFSGEWLKKVHGVASFFAELLLANGFWVALVFMFVSGWVWYLREMGRNHAIEPRKSGADRAAAAGQASSAVGSVVGGLYIRIMIMQVAIIFGAWFSAFSGSMAPLLLVIALKTLVDLALGVREPKGRKFVASTGSTSIEA